MVKLRFIGKPGGKLVKGAPGNYKQGQIVVGPSDRVENFPRIWELAEELPELIIPKAGEVDSVFDPSEVEVIEVEIEPELEPGVEAEPEEDEVSGGDVEVLLKGALDDGVLRLEENDDDEEKEEPVKLSREYNLLDPNRASDRSFRRVDTAPIGAIDDETRVHLIGLPTVEALQSWTKKQLMEFLDSQGAEYKQRMSKAEILEKAKSLL